MATRSLDSLSGLPPEIQFSCVLDNSGPELAGVAASDAQKRGRGRPPKRKPDFNQDAEFPTNLNEPPVPVVFEESPLAIKRPRGRPRKDGTPTAPPVRGRGRPRKSKLVSPVTVKQWRETTYDPVAAIPASTAVAVSPPKRRGRPPKFRSVISVSRTGRPRGRPRKYATPEAGDAAREEDGRRKRKHELLREKVKEATDKLKAAVSAMEEVQLVAAAMNAR
ncbi:PREDICTED: putative DNA-binding protein At1g48610 [Tarenaya hassleriana]|uniref:putative DNA-binding protein At1g48610 n=1 Tax=Tarenaya hassleriana TaxID=28532 RepID=UPI00053C46E8|nr:PREDICTED: putative DNA-binding protein At1g48610 [Tarenaya hassleriana]